MSARLHSAFRSISSHPPTSNGDASASSSPNEHPPPHGTSPHQIARPGQYRATTLATPLSSSYTKRAPARSFVHHASLSSPTVDPVHYSSAHVREQTANLAQSHLSLRRPSSAVFDDARPRFRQNSLPVPASGPIEEVNELVQTGEPSSKFPHGSALTHLFHNDTRASVRTSGLDSVGNLFNPQQKEYLPPPKLSVTDTDPESMASEITRLIPDRSLDGTYDKHYGSMQDPEQQLPRAPKSNKLMQLVGFAVQRTSYYGRLFVTPKRWSGRAVWEKAVLQPVSLLPCVFLGVLLNVLDALSYGMILFPLGEDIFANTGADGISMFYVSCIVSQLVFSFGGSIFKGAVGSEMIEVVPFFHKMTYSIMARTGTANPKAVLATVITAYALSSIMTGLVFFLLGAFKLGSLVSFFPRHILIGCIGGVGFFLFVTGIEVSARLDGTLEYDLDTLRALFRKDTVALWTIPLALSIILKISKSRISDPQISPYIVPVFFIAVAATFYVVVTASPLLNIPQMRRDGWIFAQVEAGVPFYHFYTYYDFQAVDWSALASTIPAMFALTFFGILHVPINVPALAVAAKEDDLNLNRELVAHGFSNALSGLCGSIQNYLVYVNSELFISNGGDNRLAGIMLACATFGVLVAGPDMIGFVPIMVVGALIFYLGIDLMDEALVDTWGKMGWLEYLTVVAIVLIMGIYDFVAGILAGIILACLNFVVQTSRKSAIRVTYSGNTVQSTVRRHPVQRQFLREVGHQIYVTKLAGYLFFGSIVAVEKNSRALIEEEAFRRQSIRYLVFDLAHVNGIDYSAAEAFVRMQRVIQRRGVRMLVSGVKASSEVGVGLRNVGLWNDSTSVKFFETLNNALEDCENELLRTLYAEQNRLSSSHAPTPPSLDVPGQPKPTPGGALLPLSSSSDLAASSPRQVYLREAASSALSAATRDPAAQAQKGNSFAQPLPLLLDNFQDISILPHNSSPEDFWFRFTPYFARATYAAGTPLFERGDAPDAGFFLLESGELRAAYELPAGTYHECIVAGTTCGELPFFSGTSRTATVVAERDSVCWVLDARRWEKLQADWSEGATELLRCALRLTKERMDAVTGYVIAAAG